MSERGSHDVLTDCGLPGIRAIPYGVHMCHFYRSREELTAALVPYFAAGLARNERCLWVCSEPLRASQARVELARSGVDVDAAIARGALIVRDYDDWYQEAGSLKGTDVVQRWLAEEARALADGYAGLRITGNVTFLAPGDWDFFMEYEALVSQRFHGRRIVTLCTYRADCAASEMLDVMQRHTCTLDRPDRGWQIVMPA